MGRTKRLVWAVCLGSAMLAGCNTFLRPGSGDGVNLQVPVLSLATLVSDGQLYYSLSVRETSISMQDLLRRLGLPVSVTEDPSGAVRIVSSTPQGASFTLVLRPDASGKRTHVTMAWDNATDRSIGVKVLLDLETRSKKTQAAQ
jgi:hypothetical protein